MGQANIVQQFAYLEERAGDGRGDKGGELVVGDLFLPLQKLFASFYIIMFFFSILLIAEAVSSRDIYFY